ncbi:Reverse transcriptase zinc-binding domain [Macleaya cordata]|uniref:Reverse transcriptase zinc-binding domain n=1 Tax=Macleaya cordata TaxID=56857 RepID=A0A200PYH2_MACCD|nr:Reverse transcriptase zinc-binding domain [Macleaya cordata]
MLGSMSVFFMSCYKLPKAITHKLLCFQRDFWWNHSETDSKMVFLAWSHICKPKDMGGLGFKDPEKVNNAFLAKVAWRFLTNKDSFWNLFYPHEFAAILKIRLPAAPAPDKLLWLKTKTGEFSIKSVYRSITQAEPSSSGLVEDNFDWSKFWKIRGISPRVHLFLWRLLHNALALKANISKHTSHTDSTCLFCFSHEETADHLFLHCFVVKQIWFSSPIGLCIDTPDLPYTLVGLFNFWLASSEATEVFKLGCALVWCIWKARNQALFDNIAVQIDEVVKAASSLYIEHSSTTTLATRSVSSFTSQQSSSNWIPPPLGSIKINVDGATLDCSIAAGIVARNSTGDFLEGHCFFDEEWLGVNGAIKVEARAFLKGLELAQALQTPSLILEEV